MLFVKNEIEIEMLLQNLENNHIKALQGRVDGLVIT